jgi:hypothetical protein
VTTGALAPGTLVAVPSGGGWYFLVFIASNRFGDALGVLKETRPAPDLPEDWRGDVLPRPLYTTLKPARRHGWRLLPPRPALVGRFPADPEIYHDKRYHPANPAVGEFGSAEAPDGRLRAITEAEARDAGLLSGEYRQTLLPEDVLTYLERHVGAIVPMVAAARPDPLPEDGEDGVAVMASPDGRHCLTVTDVGDQAASFFADRELQGGGHTWQGVLTALVEMNMPDALPELDIGAEADNLYVHAEDEGLLHRLAELWRATLSDPMRLARVAEHAGDDLE